MDDDSDYVDMYYMYDNPPLLLEEDLDSLVVQLERVHRLPGVPLALCLGHDGPQVDSGDLRDDRPDTR